MIPVHGDENPGIRMAYRWIGAALSLFIAGSLCLRWSFIDESRKFDSIQYDKLTSAAWDATSYASDYLSWVARSVKHAAKGDEPVEPIKDILKRLSSNGVASIAVYNGGQIESSAGAFFEKGGVDDLEMFFVASPGAVSESGVLVSNVFIRDVDGSESGVWILVYAPGGQMGGANAFDEHRRAVVVAVNPMALSERIQQSSRNSTGRNITVVDSAGRILAHPEPEYIGAGIKEAMALDRHEQLSVMAADMIEGNCGKGIFTASGVKESSDEEKWLGAYVSDRFGGRQWAALAAEREKDMAFKSYLANKHLVLGLVWGAVIGVLTAAGLRARFREIEHENRERRLGDVAAVNNMLLTVNSELNEERRKHEEIISEIGDAKKIKSEHLDKLENALEQFFSSHKKGSKEHREKMRELRSITRSLRQDEENL
jgi:hypothetical protein